MLHRTQILHWWTSTDRWQRGVSRVRRVGSYCWNECVRVWCKSNFVIKWLFGQESYISAGGKPRIESATRALTWNQTRHPRRRWKLRTWGRFIWCWFIGWFKARIWFFTVHLHRRFSWITDRGQTRILGGSLGLSGFYRRKLEPSQQILRPIFAKGENPPVSLSTDGRISVVE